MIFPMCGTRENPRESALFLKNITKITTFSPFEKVTKHRIFKKLQEKNVKSRFFGLRETLCEIGCVVYWYMTRQCCACYDQQQPARQYIP